MHVSRQYLVDTIARKGWAVHELHDFEDDADAFEPLNVAAPPSANCSRYATALTYLVSTSDGSDPMKPTVQQGGKALPARRLGAGSYAVDADPTQGDAVLQ